MAFTLTNYAKTVFGNQSVWMGKVTADAASGVVSFGFVALTALQVSPASAATAAGRFRLNATAAGVASNGDLGISGVAAGDEFYVTIYGR